MKILELNYKNILSYGNRLQTLSFDDEAKLILVEGENGCGKSSIKEALTVSIYGKSAIRKIKDIPNWINRNAYTQIKFLTNTGDHICLSRGIDPNFSNIEINGAPFNLPDKRKVDEFIEEELAKIPFTVFCNTVSLSFDDFKSFINLSQSDKRKIVDRIFGIDILTDIRSSVKEDLKRIKSEIDLINSQIFKDSHILDSSTSRLLDLREKLSRKKDAEVDSLKNKISEKKESLEQAKEKYLQLKKTFDDAQVKVNSIRDEISKNRATSLELVEKLKNYQKNRCPHCLNDLTTDSSLATKSIIENRKVEIDAAINSLKEDFDKISSELQKIGEDQNDAKSAFYQVKALLDQLEAELKKATSSVKSYETESIEAIIETIQNNISQENEKLRSCENSLDISSSLDFILSDTGVKKVLIDKIIPVLNARIYEISTRLEFKFKFEFDNNFDPMIFYMGLEISPESLSSGQRKKMNLIVLLAFIELIKMKHPQMNILFLDEIFSSLDKNNVYMAIDILREYSIKYNMTIFVVSHESLPEELFNYRIFVQNRDHFSEMSLKKIGQSHLTN